MALTILHRLTVLPLLAALGADLTDELGESTKGASMNAMRAITQATYGEVSLLVAIPLRLARVVDAGGDRRVADVAVAALAAVAFFFFKQKTAYEMLRSSHGTSAH